MAGLRAIILLGVGWVVLVLACRWIVTPVLRRGPDRDPVLGLLWRVVRVFCRIVHRARFEGLPELRRRQDPGGLVLVSNHTGAIDPFVIQAGCRFHVRWLMAEEQMFALLDPFWKRQGIIPVARDGTDLGPAREAIRHVKAGGVVGIFPEGRIVTPAQQVWPFFAGVGLIVARTRAPVLLVWVSGTPDTNETMRSLFTRSRARVRYVERIDFGPKPDAAAVTEDLRRRLHEVSGWPLNDNPPPPPAPEARLEMG